MTWQISIFSMVLWGTALILWAGAYGAWHRQKVRGAVALSAALFVQGLWAFAQGTRIASADLGWQMAWFRLQWIASALPPTLWLIFFIVFVGQYRWLTRGRLLLLFIQPAAVAILVLANDSSYLLWTGTEALDILGLHVYYAVRGVGYQLVVFYSYVLIITSLFLLLRGIWYAHGIARRQLVLILIGLLVPLAGNIMQVISPVSKLIDITVVLFLFSGTLYLWALFGMKLLEIVPIARNTVIDNLQDGVIVVDRRLHIVDSNPGARHFLNSTHRDEALEGCLAQDVLPAVIAEIWSLSSSPTVLRQTVRVDIDGRPGFCAMQLIPIYEQPGGDLSGWVLTLRDVTREQEMMAERERLREQQMDIKLEQERIRLLSQFIQNAAHEFRTPLTVIQSATSLIERLDDSARRLQKAAVIHKQIERTTRLLDMLLRMISLENGQMEPLQPVDMVILLDSVCQQARAKYGAQPALEWVRSADLLYTSGDPEYLQEAFNQLLDNAYRFTPPEGTISVRIGPEKGMLAIDVEDSGPGISEVSQEHIFETFWRHDVAHSTPGFGLGLPIARKIVQMHHGRIELDSQIGRGSRFRILLPQIPAATD